MPLVTTWPTAWCDPAGIDGADVGHLAMSGLVTVGGPGDAISVDMSRGRWRHGIHEPLPPRRSSDGSPTVKLLDSELERRHDVDWRSGIACRPCGFHRRGDPCYEVDFWVVDTPVILEMDSSSFHDDARYHKFEYDRLRNVRIDQPWLPRRALPPPDLLTRQPPWVSRTVVRERGNPMVTSRDAVPGATRHDFVTRGAQKRGWTGGRPERG